MTTLIQASSNTTCLIYVNLFISSLLRLPVANCIGSVKEYHRRLQIVMSQYYREVCFLPNFESAHEA